MPKVKYYYDSESLSFKKIKTGKKTVFKNVLLFLIGSSFFGFLFIFIGSQYFQSPKERSLNRELDNMKFQYAKIDKKMGNIESVLENIEERDNSIYRIYFEASPISEDKRKAGIGGVNRYKKFDGFEYSDIIKESNKKIDIIQKRLIIQSKSLDEIAKLANEKEKFLKSIPAIQPVNNDDLTRIASGFGKRIDPFTKAIKFHYGIDFTAPQGTPVYASGDGVVTRADNRSSGYGNHIRINHGYGYTSLYAHLYKFNVKRYQRVKRGDLIGYVGNTGRSNAPHLHYEIFKDKEKINPVNFYYGNLTAKEYDELLQQASVVNQSLD
jgi:murein DD-endopeptidase MepM/ murein hydrolase activator NlpD